MGFEVKDKALLFQEGRVAFWLSKRVSFPAPATQKLYPAI
jgi:hypothetical protein